MAWSFDYFTGPNHFWGETSPEELIAKYGSPLYVYNERVLRDCCRDLKTMSTWEDFAVNYSVKANSNLSLLKIIREEGLVVDAMSLGEIAVEKAAGFTKDEIFFVSNNVTEKEMKEVIAQGIHLSVDSLSQLEMYGKLAPGTEICVRINTGIGDGHSKKVVTGGHDTKFAIDIEKLDELNAILKRYDLKLTGINQHIGSLFMKPDLYLIAMKELLDLCLQFPDLKFIDFGGGFGVPYHKMDGEARLDLKETGKQIDALIQEFIQAYGRSVQIKIEPGRYVVAESSVLLGEVNGIKTVFEKKYAGTDLGLSVLIRPAMYGSYHDIEIYRPHGEDTGKKEVVSVVGNICESGDVMIPDRELPEILEGDIVGILNAGAYGYSMASNYNNRLRPAEVLIGLDGKPRLIRRRDTIEDLLRNFECLEEN